MVRLLSGVVLGAAVFALIWFANTTTLLIVALGVATLAVHEYARLFRSLDAPVATPPTLFATWAATVVVPFPRIPVEVALGLGLVLIAMWTMATARMNDVADRRPGEGFRVAARGVAAALLATVYIGMTLGTLVGIHVRRGRSAVLLLIATIVVSDSAQFYAGRIFGRHLLAPKLSPKKTIEGALGGLIVAPAFLVIAASYLIPTRVSTAMLALVGVALVVAGIAGDLFESMLKRAAGVKDSSALIPGHGGVLDRIDALLFAAPVFYFYVRGLHE